MSRWNTDGLVVIPNGITVYLKQPRLVTKADLSRSCSAIGILWYPARKSMVLNHVAPANALRQLSINGSG